MTFCGSLQGDAEVDLWRGQLLFDGGQHGGKTDRNERKRDGIQLRPARKHALYKYPKTV